MNLNERKIQILEAIINDYILTAEPIGSRTIAKKYNLGISSATIRNEMSDLEELGLIIQPHASAGRVPSDKGYRLYVDKLMKRRELTELEVNYLQQAVINSVDQIDYLMQEAAKAISILTRYTAIVSKPTNRKTKIKHLQLIPFDEKSVVLVVITNTKDVKNQIISVSGANDTAVLNRLTNLLNEAVKDKTVDDLNYTLLEDLKNKHQDCAPLLESIFKSIIETLDLEDHAQVFLSGTKNILEFPEFNDISKAKDILQAFEEKELLFTLLNQNADESISIVIGDENNVKEMKDCSIIKSSIRTGEDTYSSIGILGPTRMDYSQSVSILKGIAERIEKALQLLTGG